AVMLGEDLAQLRHRLFGAVLLVAAQEDDVLSLAGAVATFEDEPQVVVGPGGDRDQGDGERGESEHAMILPRFHTLIAETRVEWTGKSKPGDAERGKCYGPGTETFLMTILATLAALLALADGMEVAEALPLTDRILMVHLKEGHAVHHQKGQRRDEGERVIVTLLDPAAASR